MADRVSASITIGGSLTAAQAETLIALITDEGLSTEWDGACFEAADLVEGAVLELCAHEVPWGMFGALETYCVANRIAFVRSSDACPGAFGGERVVYRGRHRDTTESFGVDASDAVVIDKQTVLRLGTLNAILAHFDSAAFRPGPVRLI